MEISTVIIGMFIFAIYLFIANLYAEIRTLTARLSDKAYIPHYDSPPAPPRQEPRTVKEGSLPPTGPPRLMLKPDPITRPFSARLLEQKDEEIKSLEQRNKNQKEYLERKNEEISNLKAYLHKAKFDYACEVASEKTGKLQKRIVELESIIADKDETIKILKPEFVNFEGECPACLGKGRHRRPYTNNAKECDHCNGTGKGHPGTEDKTEEQEGAKARYLRAINVLKSVRHNLRVGGQKEKTQKELAERVKSCITEYNSNK